MPIRWSSSSLELFAHEPISLFTVYSTAAVDTTEYIYSFLLLLLFLPVQRRK